MDKNEALENIKETLYKVWEKKLEETPNGICCVCGHPLDSHRDEGEYWRCHHLDASGYQCECRLIKKTHPQGKERPLSYYDLRRRIESKLKEMKEGKL